MACASVLTKFWHFEFVKRSEWKRKRHWHCQWSEAHTFWMRRTFHFVSFRLFSLNNHKTDTQMDKSIENLSRHVNHSNTRIILICASLFVCLCEIIIISWRRQWKFAVDAVCYSSLALVSNERAVRNRMNNFEFMINAMNCFDFICCIEGHWMKNAHFLPFDLYPPSFFIDFGSIGRRHYLNSMWRQMIFFFLLLSFRWHFFCSTDSHHF